VNEGFRGGRLRRAPSAGTRGKNKTRNRPTPPPPPAPRRGEGLLPRPGSRPPTAPGGAEDSKGCPSVGWKHEHAPLSNGRYRTVTNVCGQPNQLADPVERREARGSNAGLELLVLADAQAEPPRGLATDKPACLRSCSDDSVSTEIGQQACASLLNRESDRDASTLPWRCCRRCSTRDHRDHRGRGAGGGPYLNTRRR
jgi:hypothetical protein